MYTTSMNYSNYTQGGIAAEEQCAPFHMVHIYNQRVLILMHTIRLSLQVILSVMILLSVTLPITSTTLAEKPVFEHEIQAELPSHPTTNNDNWIVKWNNEASADFI